jgi:phosphopantetheinyl transferase (holo-ACP synthase)
VVVGLGVDLVELGRVAKALDRWGSRLVAKLMDAEEAGRLPADGAERARLELRDELAVGEVRLLS